MNSLHNLETNLTQLRIEQRILHQKLFELEHGIFEMKQGLLQTILPTPPIASHMLPIRKMQEMIDVSISANNRKLPRPENDLTEEMIDDFLESQALEEYMESSFKIRSAEIIQAIEALNVNAQATQASGMKRSYIRKEKKTNPLQQFLDASGVESIEKESKSDTPDILGFHVTNSQHPTAAAGGTCKSLDNSEDETDEKHERA